MYECLPPFSLPPLFLFILPPAFSSSSLSSSSPPPSRPSRCSQPPSVFLFSTLPRPSFLFHERETSRSSLRSSTSSSRRSSLFYLLNIIASRHPAYANARVSLSRLTSRRYSARVLPKGEHVYDSSRHEEPHERGTYVRRTGTFTAPLSTGTRTAALGLGIARDYNYALRNA